MNDQSTLENELELCKATLSSKKLQLEAMRLELNVTRAKLAQFVHHVETSPGHDLTSDLVNPALLEVNTRFLETKAETPVRRGSDVVRLVRPGRYGAISACTPSRYPDSPDD